MADGISVKIVRTRESSQNSRIGIFEDADSKNKIKFANFKRAEQIFKKIGCFIENLKETLV